MYYICLHSRSTEAVKVDSTLDVLRTTETSLSWRLSAKAAWARYIFTGDLDILTSFKLQHH